MLVNQNVAGLQVSMHNPASMGIIKAFKDLQVQVSDRQPCGLVYGIYD